MGYQSTTQLTSGDLELSDVQKKRLLFIISWLHSVWFYKKWCDFLSTQAFLSHFLNFQKNT